MTTREVQAWVDGLAGELAPASIHKCVQTLSKILAAAVRDGRLPDREARFLSSDELLRLECVMSPRWSLVVPFLADVGLRIGAAAALRWQDVDTISGRVIVRQTYAEVRGEGMFTAPKTRVGRRVAPMLTPQVAERLKASRRDPSALVFSGASGGAMRPAAWRARVWRPAVAKAELAAPLPTLHALRHIAVARWIGVGVEPYKLAVFAGPLQHRDARSDLRAPTRRRRKQRTHGSRLPPGAQAGKQSDMSRTSSSWDLGSLRSVRA